jgi:three-Cys-motif partner protein
MSKSNITFFKEKKVWSEVKDELLGCYLAPYFSKLLATRKPILYVDCFAGKGKFDDGKDGSPLIALKTICDCQSKSKFGGQVVPYFIELNHATDLQNNITQYSNANVVDGKFEDNIAKILNGKNNHNVFLYIDPYGIKALDCSLFDSIAQSFNTAELLINLNSFGFIREACRAMTVSFREQERDVLGDLEEYDTSVMQPFESSIQELNAIAGGDYWQQIISDYKNNVIDCYAAERRFSAEYKQRLGQHYKYVLDMPIRLKSGQHPKYRMIHATNHHMGCVIMADNIAKRTDRLFVEIQNAGQLSLLAQSAENEILDDNEITDKLVDCINTLVEFTPYSEYLAEFYNKNGVLCQTSRLADILKPLEGQKSKFAVILKRRRKENRANFGQKHLEKSSG